MAHKNCYLVSYDIRDAKRLRRVHNVMQSFGRRIHYSVFLCDLYPKGRMELISVLTEIIKHDEDRVMIVDLGPSDGRAERVITFLGVHEATEPRDAIIV